MTFTPVCFNQPCVAFGLTEMFVFYHGIVHPLSTLSTFNLNKSYLSKGHTAKSTWNTDFYFRHPEDIDVFAGGLSETPVEDAVIGPLFSCIIGQQFYNLKYGDRFYYENEDEITGFTEGMVYSRSLTLIS